MPNLGDITLVEEALRASGVGDKARRADFRQDLDLLFQKVRPGVKDLCDPAEKAQRLFDWLWSEKPARYKSGGPYRLSEVIEAQISRESLAVGNCLGLTILYNCLLEKMDIKPKALYLEDAFGLGPHVLTVLPTKDSTLDVEHIFPYGFGYKGHLRSPFRTIWGDMELIADIYYSQGNDCFEEGEYIEALKNYDMSLKFNPQYEKARINKAILLDKMDTEKRGRP